LFFFFFQAEDGIRDIGVTGVQTCALPIWALLLRAAGDGGIASGELPADPLRRRALAAARRRILQLREAEEIGDDAFHRLEEEFDRAELSAETG